MDVFIHKTSPLVNSLSTLKYSLSGHQKRSLSDPLPPHSGGIPFFVLIIGHTVTPTYPEISPQIYTVLSNYPIGISDRTPDGRTMIGWYNCESSLDDDGNLCHDHYDYDGSLQYQELVQSGPIAKEDIYPAVITKPMVTWFNLMGYECEYINDDEPF